MKAIRYTSELIQEYIQKGYWNTPSMSEIFDRNSRLYPDKEALLDSRLRLTFGQAKLLMDRLALGLIANGMNRDEVLFVLLPNSIEQYLLRLATEKAGIIYLPVRRQLGIADVVELLRRSGAAGIVIPGKTRDRNYFQEIQSIRSRLPNLRNVFIVDEKTTEGAISVRAILDQSLETYYPVDLLEKRRFQKTEVSWLGTTTGTGGVPKIIRYLTANRPTQGIGLVERLKITEDDIVGLFSPAIVGPNIVAYFGAPMVGAKVVMLENFEPEEALKLLAHEKITVITGSPALLVMMARSPNLNRYDHSSLRLITCGGAPLEYAIGREIEAKLEAKVVQFFGATDCGVAFFPSSEDPPEIRIGTAGKPLLWGRVKIVDPSGKEAPQGEVGEVLMTGPAASDGYWGDTETTKTLWTNDGWFRTGDLGKLDELGNLRIVGRMKDIIIRGGDNISPLEIENALLRHPGIISAAVVGMPDQVLGEKACAFVELKPGQQLTFEEMLDFLKKAGLRSYMLPERLEITSKMPISGEGKIYKRLLVQQVSEKLKAEGKI